MIISCAVTLTLLMRLGPATAPLATKYEVRAASGCVGEARVRKRSTLNVERPYQPIYPLKGAWPIKSGQKMNVWVGRNWRVEYWSGAKWVAARMP